MLVFFPLGGVPKAVGAHDLPTSGSVPWGATQDFAQETV